VAKASLDAAQGIPYSTIVTAATSNGAEFAIRVGGLGNHSAPFTWFKAAAPVAKGTYWQNYTDEDACPVIGDSYSTECTGAGAFAMAAAPAITEFVGGTTTWAVDIMKQMYKITQTENKNYKIPYLDYRGTPTGIDLVKVMSEGILPFFNTGIAHKEPGIGQIGAGYFWAPRPCFEQAADAFNQKYDYRVVHSQRLK